MLAGRPLIAWALRTLAGCTPIVIAVPPHAVARAREVAPEAVVVAGGQTRQQSVRNALRLIETARVVVHDAARPLASSALVARTIAALGDAEGAVAGIPMDDTLKLIEDGRVVRTVDRTGLWRIQTPQCFRTDALVQVHDRAADEGFVATDDAQLLERYGMRVVLVEGEPANIKVTRPDDFAIAEALLERA